MTPLRRLAGWNGAIRFRRMLGLFAFFYATLHFLTWAILDRYISLDFPQGPFSWSAVRTFAASVGDDIYKRKFITIGFSAFVAMWPLALTSTAGMIRRLGGRRWQQLHRLIYFSAVAGVVHYLWLVKSDIRRPITYRTDRRDAVGIPSVLGADARKARTRSDADRRTRRRDSDSLKTDAATKTRKHEEKLHLIGAGAIRLRAKNRRCRRSG